MHYNQETGSRHDANFKQPIYCRAQLCQSV